MKIPLLLSLIAVVVSFAEGSSSPAKACTSLQSAHPELTFFPNQTTYKQDNEDFFTSKAWLGPACVFTPTESTGMSYAVKLLGSLETKFAVRGGGHMPIADAANINSSGVLLSASKLRRLELSSDQTSVWVGPGNRWGDVYKYLESYGLTIVGGRMGVVGVPGFLLGGGISFFSNEHGWASDNVLAIECVLADGTIVEASGTNQYFDLFWALRGGGNSFCLATNFKLRTLKAPQVLVGQTNYGAGVWAKFRDAVFDFAMKGSADFRSAVTPIIRWGVGEAEPSYHSMLFHNGPEDTPVSLANFTAPVFSTLNNSMSRRSMHQWTLESDAGFDHIHGLRQRFYVVSLYANKEAMDIVHNTWFTGVQKELSSVQNFFTGVAFMPIAKNYIIAGNKRGGDPMGVDSSKAPYIWVEESMMWSNPADDAKIDAFLKSVNKDIDSQLGPKGYQAPYLYLNDADKGQPVFQGYTKGSVQKLKAIRAKYDPKRAFTDLMPGGWKVDSV